MKNVLILSSSPRVDGNSDTLAKEFRRGAEDAGHNVELVRLNEKNIGYCIGCYACHTTGTCFKKDDMAELYDKMLQADVIVFATPVYFYTMSGQLKVFIDRLTPIYERVRADIYLMCTAWDPDVKNLELTIESIRGLTRDCFEECEEKGVIVVGNVGGKGEIQGRPELIEAYNMGKNC